MGRSSGSGMPRAFEVALYGLVGVLALGVGLSLGVTVAGPAFRDAFPQAFPTPAPVWVTATPKGAGAGAAVFGAPGQAFIGRYGPLTGQSDPATGDLHFRQYPGDAQDFLIVDLGARYGITPGDQDAASILVSAPPSQPWTPTQAQAACSPFLPADAQRVMAAGVKDAQGLHGQDVVYRSAALARTFPASAFVDANQHPVTPGTFDVYYLYRAADATGQTASCEFLVGSQQTKP